MKNTGGNPTAAEVELRSNILTYVNCFLVFRMHCPSRKKTGRAGDEMQKLLF